MGYIDIQKLWLNMINRLLQYVARVQELGELGYFYCPKTNWWWNLTDKVCVDNNTISLNYDNFTNRVLNVEGLNGFIFYSYTRSNRDILDTLYCKRFPNSKQKGIDK